MTTTHTPAPWAQTNNGPDGICTYCGRDNRGYENCPCSDDCAYELARAEAPAMLDALRTLMLAVQADGVPDGWGCVVDPVRAILARIDGEG